MAEFDRLLQETRKLHATHKALQDFCDFPTDLVPQDVAPHHIPAADLFVAETGLQTDQYLPLRDALVAASPRMKWRETYKGTTIDPDFMARFGCYEIIGVDAPFASKQMRSFMVYQPAGLHYPWHQHPAAEIYVVLAGQAEFHIEGRTAKTLHPGDHAFHPSGVPHALTAHRHPILAYVAWRDAFDTAPVWRDADPV